MAGESRSAWRTRHDMLPPVSHPSRANFDFGHFLEVGIFPSDVIKLWSRPIPSTNRAFLCIVTDTCSQVTCDAAQPAKTTSTGTGDRRRGGWLVITGGT